MGVYINGMEMPTSCDDCFLPLRYCPYAMKPNGKCPLVPVPPHGRLIDADNLEHISIDWEMGEIARIDAPTIIPADKEAEK